MKGLLNKLLWMLIVCLIVGTGSAVLGQAKKAEALSPFPHKVIYKRLDPKVSETDVIIGHLDVLISPRYFTTPKLKALFRYLCGLLPDADTLFISVNDDKRDVLMEGELAPIPDSSNNIQTMKGSHAILTRTNNTERFMVRFKNGVLEEGEIK